MTNAQSAEFQQAGKPVAQPFYLVDNTGAPISSTNGLNTNASFSASSVAINDPTVTTQKMGVNASGQITVQIADSGGTNIAGVDSSHNVLTKVNAALPAGTNVIGSTTIQAASGTALAADSSNTRLQTSLYGKNAAAGDTPVAVDASGNVGVNVKNGNANGQTTMANSAPVVIASDQASFPIEQLVNYWIRNGKAYVATTGTKTATAGPYMALSLFNPNASGKTLYVYRITAWYTTTISHPLVTLASQTSDPSSGWTSPATVTPLNLDFGSANTSVAVAKQTSVGNAASLAGTTFYLHDSGANITQEVLGPVSTAGIKVEANNGLTVYLNAINTTVYAVNIYYGEY